MSPFNYQLQLNHGALVAKGVIKVSNEIIPAGLFTIYINKLGGIQIIYRKHFYLPTGLYNKFIK